MDVLDQVREIGADTELSEAQVARARHAVRAEITGRQVSTGERVRRPWLRAGVITGAAAAIAAGLFVTSTLLPVGTTDPDNPPIFGPSIATAAEVLKQTAERVAAPDAGIQAGQYLLIEETQRFLEYAIEDVGIGELMPMGNRGNAELAYVTERTTGLYVPADREDEWVWDLRDPAVVVEAFGGSVEEAQAVHDRVADLGGGTPELWRLPGGRAPEGGEATLDNREQFAQIPREPQALLDWYRDRAEIPEAETDGWIVWTVSSTLTANLAPAELRAAMFEALALIEGVEITEQVDDVAVFSYRADFGDWTRTTMFTVDIENALVTAVKDASVPSGGSIVPDTVPDEQRSVVVTIVDEAP